MHENIAVACRHDLFVIGVHIEKSQCRTAVNVLCIGNGSLSSRLTGVAYHRRDKYCGKRCNDGKNHYQLDKREAP